MAINSLETLSDKSLVLSCTLNGAKGSIPNPLLKLNYATDSNISSCTNQSKTRKSTNYKSPYLDKVQQLSRVTERNILQKIPAECVSSFPLAVKIYNANSDELQPVKQIIKRIKKSVLTLPNKKAPAPQTCTVSDMNDSKDLNYNDDNRKRRPKRRLKRQNMRFRNDLVFYNGDARYCSQFNIHIDRSFSSVIKKNNADNIKKLVRKKQYVSPRPKIDRKFNGHEVWRVLRNINRFQFRPSPPMSEENISILRKKDSQIQYNGKDARFLETCRTEEFAYISSIEVDSKSSTSFSHSSSFDRVTVIDKKDEFSRICEAFENKISNTQRENSKNKKCNRNKNKSLHKEFRTCDKVQESNECHHREISSKGIGGKHNMYENRGTISNYTSNVANKVSLTCHAHIDAHQKGHNENFTKPVLKCHQKQNIVYFGIENAPNSPVNSVACKTEVHNITSKAHNEVLKTCKDKILYTQHLNGITKVVVNKGQNAVPLKQVEALKRKSRLTTTLTKTPIVPKMSQTDIRRKLLKLKFPVVILDKNQVSSPIKIIDYDPPQFEGLDKHIWPFMIGWNDDYKFKAKCFETSKLNDTLNLNAKCNNEFTLQEGNNYFQKDYKWSDSKFVSKNPIMPIINLDCNTQEFKKFKPIRPLKGKMLKLLYKKPLTMNSSEINPQVIRKYDPQHRANRHNMTNEIKILKKLDVGININDKTDDFRDNYAIREYFNSSYTEAVDIKSVAIKRPWAKTIWASDFIEGVIKKIKSGIYYSHDITSVIGTSIEAKEASVQTSLDAEKLNKRITSDAEPAKSNQQSLIKMNEFKILPGFDNSLSELEVQTFDTNKIEIKNCCANIIVRFDITVPQESDKFNLNVKKSCSLIPLEPIDSNIKLFKCKAKIFNAMLPAELCVILPDVMRKIVKSNNSLSINKRDSQLLTISELSQFESINGFKASLNTYILSPEIKHILAGNFSYSITDRETAYKIINVDFQCSGIIGLLPKMPKKVTSLCAEHILKYMRCKIISLLELKSKQVGLQDTMCKTLQPYNYQKHSVLPIVQKYKLLNVFMNMFAIQMFGHIDLSSSRHICTISLRHRKNNIDTKEVIKMINLNLDSLFETYAKMGNDYKTQRVLLEVDYLPSNELASNISCYENKSQIKLNYMQGSNLSKLKRKGFVRLYKKCKSASNIPNGKSKCFLSKISNIEEFFQFLGSKSSSCVFDGNSGKKILSFIATMKNWISEINSRQAILVLLLANKKDTPNFIRLRPVLLQGIAVNRITRASELDMEIEVIERENLNGFSPYDGISYLPASIENKDNLLEELYWIAKTTASDYQKSFDESSEKLLKNLLEKRKQLNPSYLRVMARYVGLGLLKSPTKKNSTY